MKNTLILFSFLLFILAACNNAEDKATKDEAETENHIITANNFLRAALDGNYSTAKKYVIPDSINLQTMDQYDNMYKTKMDREDKRGFREASIQIFGSHKLNDSAYIVAYANSFKNKRDSLKVVQHDGKWLVDYKYSLQIRDSIPQ